MDRQRFFGPFVPQDSLDRSHQAASDLVFKNSFITLSGGMVFIAAEAAAASPLAEAPGGPSEEEAD
jgi:hypothetical protein